VALCLVVAELAAQSGPTVAPGTSSRSATVEQVLKPGAAQTAEELNLAAMIAEVNGLEQQGNLPAARNVVEKLVACLKRSQPSGDLLPAATDRLASLEQQQGNYREAEHLFESAVQLWEARPNSPGIGLATELNNLASLYSEIGQLERAVTVRRRSLALRIQLLGNTDPKVALSHSNLASDLLRRGQYDEAEEHAQLAAKIWDRCDKEKNQADLAYNTLARIQLLEGDTRSAISSAQLAIQTFNDDHGKSPVQLAGYKYTLALAEEKNGDVQAAVKSFQDSLDLLDSKKTELMMRVGVLRDYSQLLARMGQTHQALSIQSRAKKEAIQLMKSSAYQYTVEADALRAH
jgi:tetratricopeptide (TPR) repeat protein